MTNFTFSLPLKPLILAVMPALFLPAFNGLYGQFHILSIKSPADLEKDYDVLQASFGPSICETSSVSGELILVEDSDGGTTACSAIENDLTGKIAVLDRGDCNFDLKVLNAQDQGAVAVIVCNNANPPQPIFIMAGSDLADQVTIPSFMISQADCAEFRDAIADGVTIEINRDDPEYEQAVVVWGNQPGQGDFNGGLNGWEVRNISCGNGPPPANFDLWRWQASGEAYNGSCSNGSEIFSPSKCNGAMVFESDFYENDGGDCAAGGGECTTNQVGELISPSIDLTGSTATNFSVRFFQETLQFGSIYWVGWSTDGGTTWDSTEVNADLRAGDFNPLDESVVKVPLTGVSNQDSDLRVKFRYEGNYYYWIVDDVQIIEQEANNLRVNRNFFAVPQNFATPFGQVEPIYFLADIENIGWQTQTNVVLDLTIDEWLGQGQTRPVFDTQLDYADVPGNTLVENIPFDESYTPEATGIFLGRYQISADQEDSDPDNTFQDFFYAITDTVFSKENGATKFVFPAELNWDQGAAHNAAYGNHFHVVNDKTGKGEQIFISSVSFGIGNADELAGNELLIAVYTWDDANDDGQVQPAERILKEFNTYLIQGTEAPTDLLTVPIPNPIPAEANTDYLVMVQYTAPTGTPAQDFIMVWSDDTDYNAMVFVNGAEIQDRPRYASVVALASDLPAETFEARGYFGLYQVPVVRMNIAFATSNRQVQALKNKFVVFPNPTSGEISLRMSLDETAQSARVRIFDMAGRLLMQRDYDNVQHELLNYNVSSFQSGTYMIELSTEKGTGTRRFVVAD